MEHLNAQGAGRLAETIYRELKKTQCDACVSTIISLLIATHMLNRKTEEEFNAYMQCFIEGTQSINWKQKREIKP
jgi:hypothetical protein